MRVDIDTAAACGERIHRSGAHRDAEPALFHEEVNRKHEDNRNCNAKKRFRLVDDTENGDSGSLQERRHGKRRCAPADNFKALDDIGDCHSSKNDDRGCCATLENRSNNELFQNAADDEAADDGQYEGNEKRQLQHGEKCITEEAAQAHQIALRQIHNAGRAVNQAVAQCNQAIDTA